MELDSRGKYLRLTGREWREARMSPVVTFDSIPDDALVPVGIRATHEGIADPIERITDAITVASNDASAASLGLLNRLFAMRNEMIGHASAMGREDQAS